MPLKKNVLFGITYFLFWIVLFQLFRLVFIIVNHQFLTSGVLFIFKAMYYGLLMDTAFAAYISMPAVLMLTLYSSFETVFIKKILAGYSFIIILLSTLITTVDLFTYKAWRFRLNDRPMQYLMHPKEASAAAAHLPLVLIIIVYCICITAIFWIMNKMLFARLQLTQQNAFSNKIKVTRVLFMLLITAALIVPARGGLQQIPINQSSAYFTEKIFYNHAATNVCWVFVNAIVSGDNTEINPFAKIDEQHAIIIKNDLFSNNSNTNYTRILRNDSIKPNIIFIIWESFTEKATHLRIGDFDVTPHFNNYKKEGIYFSNIYATGDRTDKGIVAVLSGYPAQPIESIIQTPNKVRTLPVISKTLFNNGYNTAFYYGGELEFANLKAYIMSSNFSKITTIKNFESNELNSKWGAHDDVVAKKIISDLKTQPSPFFCTWLTLSSHEPFEIPFASISNNKSIESLFLNSHHYMDSVLFSFIEGCKKLPSWKNTLVVIAADHGHPIPFTTKKIDDFKIPLLFLGGALKNTNLVMEGVGSQIDIPATVLAQIGSPTIEFIWSKNLFNSNTQQWAYFCFDNGYGFVEPKSYYIFDNVGGKAIESKGDTSIVNINKGKIIQQLSFQDYINR